MWIENELRHLLNFRNEEDLAFNTAVTTSNRLACYHGSE